MSRMCLFFVVVRVEQRLLLRPLRGDLLLRLQVLLEEMVVVGDGGLRLPELLLTHLPHHVHILGWASPMVMVQCTGKDGADEGVGVRSSTTMLSIGTSSCWGT